ncbi:hypothetical protein UAW_02865 [Enterococcus haemoperoxidus ATCC BAA-382]|uniref:Uncharacterized protein n=1 Tax=Enterococcus haemoperoxidus ATCC BAA-382 TaxID=1158608 RepID=R2SXT1_9ENTE|nr:hypothetical protein [Enterococcus haemoperoxidus]EOH92824.1 hypothetical protein UAW_02865 [Enterococcus haemoperoxidus ATCC BAA-382]EOT61567.1 hypothetical protein I583_00549 [Enterococcus haemoperoxidus ATCC BAA-382]OJG55400.1 hypothetical protein RV06_GL001843 [Enterococcus haemoperoxidus]
MKNLVWKSIYFGKKIFLWVIYLLFAIYIYYLVTSSQELGSKLIFGCLGGIVLIIVILFEYLKSIYEKMIYALTVDCDLNKAAALKETLQKKDLFNGFKQSIIIFDSLLLLDEGNYKRCLNHLDNNQKFFHSTLDYLFIYYHTQLYCYSFLKDEENLNNCLKNLFKLKNVKKKQMRGLFSWNEIAGMNYFHQNRNIKCLSELELIDKNRLNNRELTYLLHLKGQCLLKLNETSEGYRLLKEAKALGNTLAIVQRI